MTTRPRRDTRSLQHLESLQVDAGMNFAGGGMRKHKSAEEIAEIADSVIAMGFTDGGRSRADVIERIRANQVIQSPERWTASEPPAHAWHLARAEDHVLRSVSGAGLTLPNELPAVGTLPTYMVNALALPVPGSSSYAIAYESGLLAFTSAWARILSAFMLSRHDEAVGIQFVDLMFCQVVLGTSACLHPDTVAVDRHIWERGERNIRPVLEAFWLAHEYSHVARGDYQRILRGEAVDRWTLELHADYYAFRMLGWAFGDLGYALLMIIGQFEAIRLFEMGYRAIGEADRGDETHPPTDLRINSIVSLARSHLTERSFDEVGAMWRIIRQRSEKYWEPLEKPLATARTVFPSGWTPNGPAEERDALGRFVRLIGEHL